MTRTPDIILSVEVGSLGTGSNNFPTCVLIEKFITMGGISSKLSPP